MPQVSATQEREPGAPQSMIAPHCPSRHASKSDTVGWGQCIGQCHMKSLVRLTCDAGSRGTHRERQLRFAPPLGERRIHPWLESLFRPRRPPSVHVPPCFDGRACRASRAVRRGGYRVRRYPAGTDYIDGKGAIGYHPAPRDGLSRLGLRDTRGGNALIPY
jgi:hypothetical protein